METSMNYLSPSEYESFGLEATTPAALILAASSVIDSHCRRATLGVAQYDERLRIQAGRNVVRITYIPLAIVTPATSAIVSARGRYAVPRRGEWPFDDLSSDVALMFGLPGTWNTIDPASIDAFADTGELTLPVNAIGLGYSEIELVYTAGLPVIPDGVKVACAQVVRNAQATPALNVKAERIDHLRLDYFADTLLDQTVRSLLQPYVAQKVG
jgi:hypothetical protein